jgi:hypothetical protein
MTATHTTGPWSLRRAQFSLGWVVWGKGKRVAMLSELDEETDENTANAVLISAAPDLLEALESVAAAWGNLPFQSPMGLKQQIDNAIAKAKGQS